MLQFYPRLTLILQDYYCGFILNKYTLILCELKVRYYKRKKTWLKNCLETFKDDKVVKAAAIICFDKQTFNEIVIISVHFKLLHFKLRTRDLGPSKN